MRSAKVWRIGFLAPEPVIRKRPEMFVGQAPPRPEFLTAGLAQDALALGVKLRHLPC
jgi:hypothetical protein